MFVSIHAARQADHDEPSDRELRKLGANLLNQQLWCWGQDVLRPEGNWLVETGFERVAAPADRENCSSVYTLVLPGGRRVVLRGFGVFYGDDRFGGVFMARYEFRPLYTRLPTLPCPPWSRDELPAMGPPDPSRKEAYATLTLDLLDWVQAYEESVAERLGHAYRQSVLDPWDDGKRPIVPAAETANAWR